MLLFFSNVILGGSKVKHVYRRAAEQPQHGVSAFVHNGHASKSGGNGNQSAVLGELGVSPPAFNPEPE